MTQSVAASAPVPRSDVFGSALALVTYAVSVAIAVAYLDAGGAEVLIGALLGLTQGAISVFRNPTAQTVAAKLWRLFETSFAAMWATMMLAGLLHDPLHNLFDVAFRALS